MKKYNLKSIILTTTIILLIVFLAFFNYYYLFKSPEMIEVDKVNTIVELFEESNDKKVKFESRYFYDQAYYSASDANNLYVFDENGKLLMESDLSKLNPDLIKDKYELSSDIAMAYAIHDKQLVYTASDNKYEYLFSVETNELVLKFRKGIVND